MAAIYRIDILDETGDRVAVIDDYLSIAYTKQVNAPGFAEFILPANSINSSEIAYNRQALFYRKDDYQDWYIDFVSLIQDEEFRQQGPKETLRITAPGAMSMLGWRHNAYYANTSNKTTFSSAKAEDIMKALITNNFTASATTGNGRIRNSQLTAFTIANDSGSGGGNTLTWNNAWVNVLGDLQKLSLVAGGDFDLYKVGETGIAYKFQFYTGQLGTDKSATITFSLENGNMADPVYNIRRANLRTVAVVAGKGEDTARETTVRTGNGYIAGENDYELFVDARNNDSGGLNASGDAALGKAVEEVRFTFKVIQTDAYRYGVDYELGDLVTTKYRDFEEVQQINKVSITYDTGNLESISIGMK